ncbi:unnamed protein product [Sympodiomycopsis kandeliae]
MTVVNIASEIPSEIAQFIREFYAISDDESRHEDYVNSFVSESEGVQFQIGPMKPATNSAGILSWRKEKWLPVAERNHIIKDVFAHPSKLNEYMLHGEVEYSLKDGSSGKASWGGWMLFNDKKDKMVKYTVWLTPEQK